MLILILIESTRRRTVLIKSTVVQTKQGAIRQHSYYRLHIIIVINQGGLNAHESAGQIVNRTWYCMTLCRLLT